MYDAIVIGSGPNGLAAAITLIQAGLSVALFEAKPTVGGGMRTAQLTLPGFHHDICSAIHPLGIGSPFFKSLPLENHGLEWIQPTVPLAHPFEDGTVVVLERSLESTAHHLGNDGKAYEKFFRPFVDHWNELAEDILAPLHFPRHPLQLMQFGWIAMRSANNLSQQKFSGLKARSLFAGLAAHAIMPLEQSLTAAFGIILGTLGHTVGWPLPKGGSQMIANALASYFVSLGGEIHTDTEIQHLEQLPQSKVVLCDFSPKQLLQIAGDRLPVSYRTQLKRYRYGPGVFKMDWALNSPIPWKAKECLQAGTVHVGGTSEEIAFSEREVWAGRHSNKPYIIIAQQSLFDNTRAPLGSHTAWGYCHLPNGSKANMTEVIENQIERFAPGFKECILARSALSPDDLELYNSNYIGGDINGGVQDLKQLFSRPVSFLNPYATPIKGLYLCSASTPPGGGDHGMCGFHAASNAIKKHF